MNQNRLMKIEVFLISVMSYCLTSSLHYYLDYFFSYMTIFGIPFGWTLLALVLSTICYIIIKLIKKFHR